MKPQNISLKTLTKYFKYLEELRQSGETNMFGGSPYLQRKFGLDKALAKKVLVAWMQTSTYDDEETRAKEGMKEVNGR